MSKNLKVVGVGIVGIAAVLATSILTPAMAGSAPTTAITTKLDANQVYLRATSVSSVNYRKLAGTASNLSEPSVDIACVNPVTGEITTKLQTGIKVTSGKWSTYVDLRSMNGYYCQLRALPSGTSPSGETSAAKIDSLKSFTGPLVRTGQKYWYYSNLGTPTTAWSYDAGVSWPASKAQIEVYGVEDGGLYGWTPRTDDGNTGRGIVNGVFSDYRPNTTGPTGAPEAHLTVDGVQAFHPYNMDSSDFNMADPDNNASYDVSISPKTGQISYSETAPLFKCSNPEVGAVYSSISRCPDSETDKLGVTWTHEVVISVDGTVASSTDTFNSVDKKKHVVRFDLYSSFSGIDAVRYAKSGTFGSISSDAKTKLSGLGVKYRSADVTSMSNPIVQLVYITAPVTTWVDYTTFYSRYNVAVVPGKGSEVKAGATLISDDSKAPAQISAASK